MSWQTYIIQCRDKTLYTGITNDLSRRISDHNNGNGCKYTKYRRPVKLIYYEEYPTKSEALKREAYIKGLTRAKKLNLVKTLRSLDSAPDFHHSPFMI
ncbi:MAG: GIY-YIG nuclease family protein [Candidatus Omnitrophota bacterium]|nr:MAG: GIY-YIG nuclease family protein [Candidatus Omnitrophota bacterium]